MHVVAAHKQDVGEVGTDEAGTARNQAAHFVTLPGPVRRWAVESVSSSRLKPPHEVVLPFE